MQFMIAAMQITEIRVRPDEVESLDGYNLFLRVSETVDYALGYGGYLSEELPDRAAHFADVWKYDGECRNGGHAQYLLNTGRHIETYRRVSLLLGDIGRVDYQVIVENFIDSFLANEKTIGVLLEEKGTSECFRAIVPMFQDLNDRFFALRRESEELTVSMRYWLLRQPWILVDENAPDVVGMTRSIPIHPLAEQRGGAAWKARAALNAKVAKSLGKKSFLRSLFRR